MAIEFAPEIVFVSQSTTHTIRTRVAGLVSIFLLFVFAAGHSHGQCTTYATVASNYPVTYPVNQTYTGTYTPLSGGSSMPTAPFTGSYQQSWSDIYGFATYVGLNSAIVFRQCNGIFIPRSAAYTAPYTASANPSYVPYQFSYKAVAGGGMLTITSTGVPVGAPTFPGQTVDSFTANLVNTFVYNIATGAYSATTAETQDYTTHDSQNSYTTHETSSGSSSGILPPSAAVGASLLVNGVCEIGNCVSPGIVPIGDSAVGLLSSTYTFPNSDRYTFSWTWKTTNTGGALGTTSGFQATYLGNSTNTPSQNDLLTVDALQGVQSTLASLSDSHTHSGTFSGPLAAGSSVQLQFFRGGQFDAQLGPSISPIAWNLTTTGAVSGLADPIIYDNRWILSFAAGSLTGATVTVDPNTGCAPLLNNNLSVTLSGGSAPAGSTTINAEFSPSLNGHLYGVVAAAEACGFAGFDWIQTITHLPNPSPFYEANPSNPTAPIQLTGTSTPFFDPPQYGYTTNPSWVSYPYYWDPNSTTQPWSLTNYLTNGNHLLISDSPADPCLQNPGGGLGSAFLASSQIQSLCGNTTANPGEYIGYTTHLAGINWDGSSIDMGIGYTWTSNFNGTSGGTATTASTAPVDPGSGMGGVAIVSINNTTTYGASGSGATLLTGSQVSLTSSGLAYSRVSQTFNGTLTLTNISNSPITGPFQLVLNSLSSGVTLVNAAGMFGGFPYITVPSITSLAPGQTATMPVQFKNPSGLVIQSLPLAYSGNSFN